MNKKLISGLLIAVSVLFTFSACEKESNEPSDPTTPVENPTDSTKVTPSDPEVKDPICKEWTSVDLSQLGEVSSVKIAFDSSDKGTYGINTPTYVCLDNLEVGSETIDFEDCVTLNENGYWDGSDMSYSFTTKGVTFVNNYNAYGYSDGGFNVSTCTDMETAGYTNQYSVYATSGANGSKTFAVVYYSEYTSSSDDNYATFILDTPAKLGNVMVNNSTYAYLSMTTGDSYAKKFEEGDWFKVIFTGYDASDNEIGTVEFYLADLRKN